MTKTSPITSICESPATTAPAKAVVARSEAGQGVRTLKPCVGKVWPFKTAHVFPAAPFFVCTGCNCSSWIDGFCGGVFDRTQATPFQSLAELAPSVPAVLSARSAGRGTATGGAADGVGRDQREAPPMVITGITSNSSQVPA